MPSAPLTAAESVAAAAGALPAAKSKRVARGKDGSPLFTTTMRITRPQWSALHRAALGLVEREGGKADASAVLREVLDAWMAKGGGR